MHKIIKDIGKALLIGTCFTLAIGLLLFLAGWLYGGLKVQNAVNVVRSGLLVAGSVGLLICSGFFIFGHGKTREIKNEKAWRKHFSRIGFREVLIIISLIIIISAIIFDYLFFVL